MMRIIFIIFLILGIIYFLYQDGHIRINNERVGFFLLRRGYRAWWVRYSNGLQCLSNNQYKNLWCLPKFEHCDIRKVRLNAN